MEAERQTLDENTVSAESAKITVMELSRNSDLSWMLMPILFERVRKFAAQYEPEGNSAVLCRAIAEDFVSDQPRFHATMTLTGGKCVGHTLTILEVIAGILYANVIQDETDEGITVDRQSRLDCLRLIEQWTKARQCNRIHAYANSEAKTRRLEIFYGFKRYKTLLRKEIL